ncbi:MAG: zinc-finger domain-containing protein [Robiginitomaculum sp.]
MTSQNPSASSQSEMTYVSSHRVSCAGGENGKGGAAGHPKVYMDMGQASSVTCKYCGREFAYQAPAK